MDQGRIQSMAEKGYNCSQQVFCYFAEGYGLDIDKAKRLSKALESGAMQGKTCGAVSGAYLVIGLEFSEDQVENRTLLKDKVDEFNKKFVDKQGKLSCKDLLGLDILTDQGYEKALEENLIEKVCRNSVISAIEILEDMLK